MNAIFMAEGAGPRSPAAYDRQTREALERILEFFEPIGRPEDLETRREDLRRVEVIFSSWGMFRLSEEQIRTYLPRLRAVFYAAGSVQDFAAPFLRCGVRVFSAYAANAIPVAEYTVAQIVLASKGFFQSAVLYHEKGWKAAHRYAETMPGNYGGTVGILGAGTIGKLVISELKRRGRSVLVFDPFLSDGTARDLGVEKCGLERLFAESPVISNHLANNERTKGIIGYRLFSAMQPNATFLNTGRGAQVVEADLVRALREAPSRTAVLDVTDPEPAVPGSPLYSLPNVFLTPHIAGSMSGEIARMGRYMYEEYRAFSGGGPARYEVTERMLETMA